MKKTNLTAFSRLVIASAPRASAILQGTNYNPRVRGEVRFYAAAYGTLVTAEFVGLPAGSFFGFHIREEGRCEDSRHSAGGHYDPVGAVHPMHAGDLPPVLGDGGYGYISFFTPRFRPADVVGKTVVLHGHPDDLKTQPSGDCGAMIACGVVSAVYSAH